MLCERDPAYVLYRGMLCTVFLSLAMCARVPGGTVGMWRFEKDTAHLAALGGAAPLRMVAEGVMPGQPVGPDVIPRTGEANGRGVLFPGRGALRIPCDGSGPTTLADGQDFTLECWLRTGASVGVNVIFSKVRQDPETPGQRAHGFDFLTIPGRGAGPNAPLHFRIYTRHDGLIYLIAVDNAMAPNTTYHVALSREETTYRVFIDGQLRGEADSDATIASDGDICLGTLGLGDQAYGGHYLPAGARMDEVRFSDTALLPDRLLLFPRSGDLAYTLSVGELTPARKSRTLVEYIFDVIPGVYDVTLFPEVRASDDHGDNVRVDLALNGRQTVSQFDLASPAASQAIDLGETTCPDGRLQLAILGHGGAPRLTGRLEAKAADTALIDVRMPIEPGRDSGWELAMPTRASLIPPTVKLTVEVSHDAQPPVAETYVPSQTLAPYPERLNPRTRSVVSGVTDLAPDRQAPSAKGIRFLEGSGGRFEIHHRRAGVMCGSRPVFTLRMERFRQLASVGLAVREGDDVVRLDSFECTVAEVRPGRVIYELTHADLGLAARLEAVSPVAVPAYGMMAAITLRNQADTARKLDLIALAAPGRHLPSVPPAATQGPARAIVMDAPRGNPPVNTRNENSPPLLLHSTDYDVLAGFSGESRTLGKNAVTQAFSLPVEGETTAFLSVVIDSPGFDEPAARSRIDAYFGRNPGLPSETRRRLTEEALDTYARIVVNGDAAFNDMLANGAAAFQASCESWDRGVYRDSPVRFELPDKKLESLANLVANDHFPGIVQPPGLVHDAKHGDTWNYIFCYRHVHAASNIGYESAAIDYLRLLSANQQPDGRIASVRADFLSPGHGTRFDASYINALYHYLCWTGDLEAVRQLWPTLQRACDHIDASLDPDGDHLYRDIIHQWKSDFDNRGPSSSFQTAIVWKAMRDMAEFAHLLGRGEDVAVFREKAAAIRKAAQEELWSDAFAMLGPRGPLGMLRLHPQSLEVEMPVWTGLVDDEQAALLTDWYVRNVSFRDAEGGLWMVDNDWWPVVWSQHMGSPGDAMMVGWALLLAGDVEAGTEIVRTLSAASYRHTSPGFTYTFDEHGVQGGGDPATAQGAFIRTLVEGLFGVHPRIHQGELVVQPRFPADWQAARFERPGLTVDWRHNQTTRRLRIACPDTATAIVRVPVEAPVRQVLLDGAPVDYRMIPSVRHALVRVETPPAGGTVTVETAPRAWAVRAPTQATVGQIVDVALTGLDTCVLHDRFGFFEPVEADASGLALRVKRAACGRAAAYLRCGVGETEWLEPIVIGVGPATAKQAQRRTVTEPLPDATRFMPVDLSDAYTDDIQTCFRHQWQWDAHDQPGHQIAYWTMPLFSLRHALPRKLRVGHVPFFLGPMGPGEAAEQKDLLMLANTPPRELPSEATVQIGGRLLRKIYILSLNMNLPQKSYVPAAEVTLHYEDGSEKRTLLTPPLNFDSFYQDFGINTMALPLPAQVGYGRPPWVLYGGVDLGQHHLTMTDIACNPRKPLNSLHIRSVATETFIGIAGLTLAEVAPTGE